MNYNCKYQLQWNDQVLETDNLLEVYAKIKTDKILKYCILRDGSKWIDKTVSPKKAYQNYCEGRI